MNLQHDAAHGIPGGEGGSVPDSKQVGVGARCSAPTGEPDSSKPAHQSTSSTGAIEAAMVAAGVFLMSSRARWAIAEQLHGHGIHSDDVVDLIGLGQMFIDIFRVANCYRRDLAAVVSDDV